MAVTVLVAESDPAVRRLVATRLEREGYDVAESGEPLGEQRPDITPELVVIEVGGRYGFQPIRAVADARNTMIIALLREDQVWDVPGALDAGADDCLRKPFSPAELVSRVRAVMRRAKAPPTAVRVGSVMVDFALRRVQLDGVGVDLTRREYELVEHLAKHSHEVVRRQDLLDAIWHAGGTAAADASLTEHIRRVRAKIEPEPTVPVRLVTVRGIGYRLAP